MPPPEADRGKDGNLR